MTFVVANGDADYFAQHLKCDRHRASSGKPLLFRVFENYAPHTSDAIPICRGYTNTEYRSFKVDLRLANSV